MVGVKNMTSAASAASSAVRPGGSRLHQAIDATVPRRPLAGVLNLVWGTWNRWERRAALQAVRGVEALGGVHVEVGVAAASYRPVLGSLDDRRARVLRELVDEALRELEPRLVVRRWHSEVGPFLDGSQPRLTTMHDLPVSKFFSRRATRAWRESLEQLRGTFGRPTTAGRTVYANVVFVPRSGATAGRDAAGTGQRSISAARTLGRLPGARGFGDTAIELSPSVRARTTIAAADTGAGMARVRVAPISRLADVVVERIARTQGFVLDPLARAMESPPMGTAGSRAARRTDLHRLLDETTRPEAVARMRDFLASDALDHGKGMIEAQVRGVSREDVLHVTRKAAT